KGRRMRVVVAALFGAAFALAATMACAEEPIVDWPVYAGDPGGSRYSPLAHIDKTNVARLAIAWEYHTGDVSDGSDGRRKSAFETTPIVADGTLQLTPPFNRVVPLAPETGHQKWDFYPKIEQRSGYSEGLINRGVALWRDAAQSDAASCARRLFLATIDARLFALDAATGQPCPGFGTNGQLDLTEGIANITRRG